MMSPMSPEDYEELIALLDGRIDELTKPIPSKQVLRFAEAIRSADSGDYARRGFYGEEDYANLLSVQEIVKEQLPGILENIRAHSIDSEGGWRMSNVDAMDGDHGLCAICRDPFQHFERTAEVHLLDMHANAFRGVCRPCVRNYAPLAFTERADVREWLKQNREVCESLEANPKTEKQRVALIDAVRRHAHSTHYFGDIFRSARDWVKSAAGEWR
ncbi:MAG: hypothetical protein HUJ26_00640 [Planctomycetaceae bacterium]|nr:hypothetical protein [Planctomycetaceae bacterium]